MSTTRRARPLLLAVVMGALAVSSDLRAQVDLPEWVVDPDPILEIGVAEGADEEMFVSVLDAVLLPDGGVAVLDAGAIELRIFDADGSLVALAGREGEGPGEFRHPFGVEVIGDSIVVWDWRRRALLFWSTGGEFLDERRAAHHVTFHEGALLPDGSILVPDYGDGAVERPSSGRHRAPARLVRYVGDDRQDLGPYPYDEVIVDDGAVVGSPFASRSASTAGGEPLRIYVADDTNIPRVRRYDDEGVPLDTIELVDTREEVSNRRWETIVDSLIRYQPDPQGVRRALEELRPDRGPAFEALRTDSEGRLWAISHSVSGAPHAVVYADGAPVAGVELGRIERIFEIGRDRLLALTLGPYDVQLVRVYRYGPR